MKFSTKVAMGLLLTATLAQPARAEDRPIKALLITGGCCHDYAHQKDLLKKGLEERANVVVDIIFVPDGSTHPALPIYGKPEYATGYDVVIHDECAADIKDEAVVAGVLKPHREDGVAGVNLHCAMHCYRIGNPGEAVTDTAAPHALWFNYLGLQSSGHGHQAPISVSYTDKDHPSVKGLEDWTTVNEELYNNVKLYDGITVLSHGKQANGAKTNDFVVTWANMYKSKTRVFSTTLGHNNTTVADPKFLDLVTRGILWAVERPIELKK